MGVVAQLTKLMQSLVSSMPQLSALIPIIVPVVVVLGSTLIGWVLELTVLARMARLAKRTAWRGDDLIVDAIQKRFVFWSFLLGAMLAWGTATQSIQAIASLDSNTKNGIANILLALFIFSLTATIAQRGEGLVMSTIVSEGHPALSLVATVARVSIYVVGFLIILQVFHISITPALAALGVGGLAVSLALQATLTDLVSGVQIIAARQVHPGDYISLSDGESGYVVDINWRTTTIRQLSNNMIIIPNSKMTSSILVNYHEPETTLSVLVNVGVSYDSDLEHVERVTIEVAKEVMQSVPGGVPDNEPFIRYNAFGDSSIDFTVILRGKEFTDQYLIKHEFIKRLHKRYRHEGIEIPYPIRTVYIKEGASDAALAVPAAVPAPSDAHQ